MSQVLANNAESGLTSGTNATQGSGGNTGGSAGQYFDSLAKGTGTAITFSSAQFAHGSLSYNFTSGGTSAAVSAKFTSALMTDTPTQEWFRIYVYLPTLPGVNQIIFQFT